MDDIKIEPVYCVWHASVHELCELNQTTYEKEANIFTTCWVSWIQTRFRRTHIETSIIIKEKNNFMLSKRI